MAKAKFWTEATPANMEKLRRSAGAVIGAPGIVAFSPNTGERYSANPGDYWNCPDDKPLLDELGESMILCRIIPERLEAIQL